MSLIIDNYALYLFSDWLFIERVVVFEHQF